MAKSNEAKERDHSRSPVQTDETKSRTHRRSPDRKSDEDVDRKSRRRRRSSERKAEEDSEGGRERRYHRSPRRDRRRRRYSDDARRRSRSPMPRTDNRFPERKAGSSEPDEPQRRKRPLEEPEERAPPAKKKDIDLLTTRAGGAYIPPAKLRMMQAQITDKTSVAFQRLAWEALKKSIHGLINKVNTSNLLSIVKDLFRENLIRARGLLARSVMSAQAASPTFTHVYAALIAIINTKFPVIGELILHRLVLQFKRGYQRNDKTACLSSSRFLAHLVNQQVAHELIVLEILTLLLENPTDDSVEVAISLLKESGMKLNEVSRKGLNGVFERLRHVLHEGNLDKRVQYMIEVMFQVLKDGFSDHPAVMEGLDQVMEEDQITHFILLDDPLKSEDILNVFKHDPDYEDSEQKYQKLRQEILDEDSGEGSGEGSGSEGEDEEESDEEEEGKDGEDKILDETETNLVGLRRTIYLTVQSSLDFEECAHKMLKMDLKPGQEVELCHMVLDCCAQQRTYEKFFGLLAQRFCQINKIYVGPFETIFKESYDTIHRLETNKLRNVAKFFAHLLYTDAISWEVLEHVKMNEEDTTSSSRIFIKILFQELAEFMGLTKLNERIKDITLQAAFAGLFPRDNPDNTRFAINFFTSIGLGGLTDELREHLKNQRKQPPNLLQAMQAEENDAAVVSDPPGSNADDSSSSSSDDSSSSDTDSSSESSSSSDDEEQKRRRKKSSKQKQKKSSSKHAKKKSKKEVEKKAESKSKERKHQKLSKDKEKYLLKKIKQEELSDLDSSKQEYAYGQMEKGPRREKERRKEREWDVGKEWDRDARNRERDNYGDRDVRRNKERVDYDDREKRHNRERTEHDDRSTHGNRDRNDYNDRDKYGNRGDDYSDRNRRPRSSRADSRERSGYRTRDHHSNGNSRR